MAALAAPAAVRPEFTPADRKCDVRLAGVRKRYHGSIAVDDVDLAIERGEFFTLLGPSGSGKTTTLRLIAGFERPDAGRIELGGEDVSGLPPYARDVNTVFQDYALFPHMRVAENIAYGLEARGVDSSEVRARAAQALAMVKLEGFGDRRPAQLSGGQRQRVALARAIVNHPRVLLLDEPLGALDLKLRQEMQIELKRIQGEVGITFLYVTHDQEEALTMSDRLAIFNQGRVEQVGTPADVYERPASEFVAGFVGVSNLLRRGGRQLLVRPEKIRLFTEEPECLAPGAHIERGIVREAIYVGSFTRYIVELDSGERVTVMDQNREGTTGGASVERGRKVQLAWRPETSFAIEAGHHPEEGRK